MKNGFLFCEFRLWKSSNMAMKIGGKCRKSLFNPLPTPTLWRIQNLKYEFCVVTSITKQKHVDHQLFFLLQKTRFLNFHIYQKRTYTPFKYVMYASRYTFFGQIVKYFLDLFIADIGNILHFKSKSLYMF